MGSDQTRAAEARGIIDRMTNLITNAKERTK